MNQEKKRNPCIGCYNENGGKNRCVNNCEARIKFSEGQDWKPKDRAITSMEEYKAFKRRKNKK